MFEIKPCPCCGSDDIEQSREDFFKKDGRFKESVLYLYCWKCGLDIMEHVRNKEKVEDVEEEMLERWNTWTV